MNPTRHFPHTYLIRAQIIARYLRILLFGIIFTFHFKYSWLDLYRIGISWFLNRFINLSYNYGSYLIFFAIYVIFEKYELFWITRESCQPVIYKIFLISYFTKVYHENSLNYYWIYEYEGFLTQEFCHIERLPLLFH